MEWMVALGPVWALLGTATGSFLTWFLTRNKTQSEKTWEERRRLYTDLISKMKALKEIVDARQQAWEHGQHSALANFLEYEIREGISFEKDADKMKEFVDANILYLSEEIEEIFEKFWQKFSRTRGLGAKGMHHLARQETLYSATSTAFNETMQQARNEIRVRAPGSGIAAKTRMKAMAARSYAEGLLQSARERSSRWRRS